MLSLSHIASGNRGTMKLNIEFIRCFPFLLYHYFASFATGPFVPPRAIFPSRTLSVSS